MKIKYLGTGAADGIPAVFCQCSLCQRARSLGGKNIRTRSQTVIDETLLIDLPPDTYYHSLTTGLDLGRAKTLLITHSHQDHFYPLELIMRGEPYAHQAPGSLTVYGNSNARRLYEIALAEENDSKNLPEVVKFCQVDWFDTFTTEEGENITPLPASHKVNERCFVYLIEKDGKRIFYGNDSGYYPEETWKALEGKPLDLISFDSTMGGREGGGSHMGLSDNLEALKRFQENGCVGEHTKAVANHFSHNGGLLYDEAKEFIKGKGLMIAYDGLELFL